MVLVVVFCRFVVVDLPVVGVMLLFNGIPSWVVVYIVVVRCSNAFLLRAASSCIHWGVDRSSIRRIFPLMWVWRTLLTRGSVSDVFEYSSWACSNA